MNSLAKKALVGLLLAAMASGGITAPPAHASSRGRTIVIVAVAAGVLYAIFHHKHKSSLTSTPSPAVASTPAATGSATPAASAAPAPAAAATKPASAPAPAAAVVAPISFSAAVPAR